MRQAAGKVAAALLPMLSPEDQNLASLIRISEQLVHTSGTASSGRSPSRSRSRCSSSPSSSSTQRPGPPAGRPRHPASGGFPDDDIPF